MRKLQSFPKKDMLNVGPLVINPETGLPKLRVSFVGEVPYYVGMHTVSGERLTGKEAVGRFFEDLGISVIDAPGLAHIAVFSDAMELETTTLLVRAGVCLCSLEEVIALHKMVTETRRVVTSLQTFASPASPAPSLAAIPCGRSR